MVEVDMTDERLLSVGIEAVRAASRVCQAVRAGLVTEETVQKRDRSPVTVADFAAQAVISGMLADAFPEIPLVAEEDTSALSGDEGALLLNRVQAYVSAELGGEVLASDVAGAIGRGTHAGGGTGTFWCLDPIDGTKGFIRGDQYAVALGLVRDGEVVLGILGCPNLAASVGGGEGRGRIYYAAKGSGAWCVPVAGDGDDPQAVNVSTRAEGHEACFCESVESGHTRHDASSQIVAELGGSRAVRLDSQCKYAVLARGEGDVYLRLPTRPGYEERIWDHAAGLCVLVEAGGMVTDVTGRPLDFTCGRTLRENRGVIATNGLLHAEVVQAVRKVLEG
jgi:3'(2'), 5'-bisphosphate nucleotidase